METNYERRRPSPFNIIKRLKIGHSYTVNFDRKLADQIVPKTPQIELREWDFSLSQIEIKSGIYFYY